jgi:2-polyprenyl-3-methyl-5-hydroxy-6-metoxy-1,4-benzoquinol methylase
MPESNDMGTDQDWEKWGVTEPYFGVFSNGKYRKQNLNPADREEFFHSGELHVAEVLRVIRAVFDPKFAPRTALDFGSGVGRLAIPMAKRMETVHGVDISPSMISEAKRNCADFGITNAFFVCSDDDISQVVDQHDLVHSYIVLQHIPWRRGRSIFANLAKRVTPGGYIAIQLLVRCNAAWHIRAITQARYMISPLQWIWNLVRSRPLTEPPMQLHVYPPDEILHVLKTYGFDQFHFVIERDVDRSFDSAMLYAKRNQPKP